MKGNDLFQARRFLLFLVLALVTAALFACERSAVHYDDAAIDAAVVSADSNGAAVDGPETQGPCSGRKVACQTCGRAVFDPATDLAFCAQHSPSSRQLYDAYLQCVCSLKCKAECGGGTSTCSVMNTDGAETPVECRQCVGDKCLDEKMACLSDSGYDSPVVRDTVVPSTCRDVHGSVGCCMPGGYGDHIIFNYDFDKEELIEKHCYPICNEVCGWNASLGRYDCVSAEAARADAQNPITCGGEAPGNAQCLPAGDCADKLLNGYDADCRACMGQKCCYQASVCNKACTNIFDYCGPNCGITFLDPLECMKKTDCYTYYVEGVAPFEALVLCLSKHCIIECPAHGLGSELL